jgi:hypothetical protein
MTTLNAYATLAEYKSYITSRNGTIATDAADDVVIEYLLRSASRYLETASSRHFTPLIETRYYDVPQARELCLDDDLLEVLTLTNGDGTVIPSTQYNLTPKNRSPYRVIRLKDNSAYIWASDGAGELHDVIAVYGIWGYHERYALAWLLGSTAAEAMDATETGYDVTSGTGFAVGNIIRFDDELGYVSAIATNTLTTSRFGQSSTSNTETVTAAGIVLAPRDIPALAMDFIKAHRRYV